MADDKSSESLSQITREDYSELANFLTKVKKNEENDLIDFGDYTSYHLTKEDVELLERHGAKQGHFIEGNNLTKIDYKHINNRLEKEAKELGLREEAARTAATLGATGEAPQDSNKGKIDSWDKVHDLETFVKFIKDYFSGKTDEEIIADYNKFYENKEEKNKFIESNGGADNLANIIKQSQENKKQNLSPRQKAEDLIKSKMINFLTKDGGVIIEEARKIVGGHRGDYGYPLKSYVKNLEVIYAKEKKILEEGGTKLSLEAIGKAMNKGIETNSIGLKRRLITDKTKKAATAVKNLMMGEIVKQTNDKYPGSKFDNLTLEQQTEILSNLQNFSLEGHSPTTSVLANSTRATNLIRQGLRNVKELTDGAVRNQTALDKCEKEAKRQIESAGNAISSEGARCAKKYFEGEINKLNGYSEENIKKRAELQKKAAEHGAKEKEFKRQTKMLQGFRERNREIIRRRAVTREQVANSDAMQNLNFSNIMNHMSANNEYNNPGLTRQLRTNKKNVRGF